MYVSLQYPCQRGTYLLHAHLCLSHFPSPLGSDIRIISGFPLARLYAMLFADGLSACDMVRCVLANRIYHVGRYTK